MKTSSTKSLLILFSVIALVFLAILIFGIYYIKSKNNHTLELISQVELGSNNSLLIQTIKSNNTGTSSEITELNEITLTKEKLVGFIENLEQMGKDHGLKIKILSVSAEDNSDKSQPQKINIQVETQGEWKPSMKYIHLVENLPYRTVINSSQINLDSGSINLSSGSTTSNKRNWKSNLSLTFYSFE